MEPDMTARTHPVEGARGRDAGGAPPEVLDEVVHTDVLVLHIRFGPNLSAAPRSEDGQEPSPDVGGRDQAQRPRIQLLQENKTCKHPLIRSVPGHMASGGGW